MGIVTVVEWIIFFFSFSLGRCKGEEGRKYLGKVSFFPFFFFFNKPFHFSKLLDTQKNCEDSTMSPQIPHIQVFLLLEWCINLTHF